jgi:hypothetical protein
MGDTNRLVARGGPWFNYNVRFFCVVKMVMGLSVFENLGSLANFNSIMSIFVIHPKL